MFIELPNETRVNTDLILRYYITYSIANNVYTLHIVFKDEKYEYIPFDTEDEAKLALYALDRAIGVKPLIIRK